MLNIGHLSLAMMEGKVSNGEWYWVDEAHCVMHTATPKPALLRERVASTLRVDLAIMRHDAALSGAGEAESTGDLIIFDMNWQDVGIETGNTKVFCQSTARMELAPLDTLAEGMKAALERVLDAECVVPSS